VSERIIAARFGGQPFNMSVIQLYAPAGDCDDQAFESFYTLSYRRLLTTYLSTI